MRSLQVLLRRFARRQLADVRHQLRQGRRPTLAHWLTPMAEVLLHALLPVYQRGMRQAARRIAQQVAHRRGAKAFGNRPGTRYVVKAPGRRPLVDLSFDVFSPHVIAECQRLVLDLCRSTLATLEGEVSAALDRTRRALAEGLEQGETQKQLNERLTGIFLNPSRAATIAQTEAQRAVSAGQLLVARESGIVSAKYWILSDDACEICKAIAARGEVLLDEPFWVNPKGKAAYAVVMHPPAHPGCQCALGESIAWDALGMEAPRALAAR